MSTFDFNDERLHHAAQRTKSVIGERNQNLDRISEDIKKLERYLDQSGVREQAQVQLSGGPACVGEPWEFEEFGEVAAEDVSEFVLWEQFSAQERWRITYLKSRRTGSFSDGAHGFLFDQNAEVLDHRPLIETPAAVRLRAAEILPDLLTTIASNVKGPKTLAKDNKRSLKTLNKLFTTVEKRPVAQSQAKRKRLSANPPKAKSHKSKSAVVSFFITQAQKAELRARGYSDDDIVQMKPAEAHHILGTQPTSA